MPQTSQLPSQSHRPTVQEVHLQDYIQIILRRRYTFISAFLAVFIGVVVYTFTMKPVYQASSTLHVREGKGKSGSMNELAGLTASNPLSAEIEILKSRTNAEEVVRRLHLDWRVIPKSKGMVCKVAELDAKLQGKVDTSPYSLEITGPDAYKLTAADGTLVGSGQKGTLLRTNGVTLLVGELSGKPGDSCTIQQLPVDEVALSLMSSLVASELGKNTNIIKVSYSSTNRYQAQEVINALVQVYLDRTVAYKTEEATRTVKFIEEQLQGLRNDLDTAELNLQGFKTSSGFVQLDAEVTALVTKISAVEAERAQVSLQKNQVEFALASLKDADKRGATYSPAVMLADPMVANMAEKLAELEIQRRGFSDDYSKNHPQMIAIQGQINEILRKLQATYETGIKNFDKQAADIGSRISAYEAQVKKLPAAERELVRLTRLAKVNADTYTFLLQKHEEARIAKASTISNIDIVDAAVVPKRPIKPMKSYNLALGLLAGLLIGLGLAFFRDYLDDTIRDGEHARRILGLPLLGSISNIPLREGESLVQATLVVLNEPKSASSEAFRALRTNIHFSAIGRDKKIILVTSTFPGEGKSTIATNLALSLAQTGSRILIIDGDLRRPSLHDKFGFAKAPGLTELLAGDIELERVLWTGPISGLECLPAGTNPPNPAELLGSEKMEALLNRLSEQFDQIIIDAPPVLAVTDAPLLTAICDLVLVVMEVGRVPVKAAMHMKEMLVNVQAPIAGIVLNDKTGVGDAYGGYGYGGYGYGYGYGYYSDEIKPKKKGWWSRVRMLFKRK